MKRTNFYRIFTICFLSIGLVSCAPKAESESTLMTVSPALISEKLVQAEELFRQREDAEKIRQAVQILASVRNPDARNYEVEWKFAKYNYFLGKKLTNEKEKEKVFEDGKQAGRIASRIEPNKPEGYFWYGANFGELAQLSPVTVGLKSVDDIREAMNKVIEIQPDYQAGSGYVALAQIELNTAGMLGGKPEKAVEYLEKALTLNKENAYIYLHLAEAYLAVGRKVEARKQLEYLLKMTPNPNYLPEYKETTEKAKKLLETKFR